MIGRIIPRMLGLILAWSCGTSPLRAQDAPYRPALNRLRTALDTAQTLEAVNAISAEWSAGGKSPVNRLADAYIELRRGVVTNSRLVLTSAWTRFDQVVRVHPDWPYARLGLAVAALEIYSRRYPLPASYDDVAGGTHYDGFTIQMKRTLRTEPTFQPAINWLTSTLSEEGDREQPRAILEALQFIADSTNSTDPRVQLILARAERLHGDATQSIPRIDAYLREGGDSGVAELELARSFAWMGDLDNAATEYMVGAAVQTAEGRAIYRLDLSWVATPRELARFDSLPSDSIAAFIGHFWSKRDVQELRPDGSRLQEHLRRWVYVSQNYRVPDPGRRTAYKEVYIPYNGLPCAEDGARSLDDYDYTEPARQGAYRAPERVFDHRAIVYMRHGEPLYEFGGAPDSLSYLATNRAYPRLDDFDATRLRQISTNLTPFTSLSPSLMHPNPDRNTTWVYLMGGKMRAFTFLGHQALGTNSPSTLVVYSPPNLDVLMQLAQVSSLYARLANHIEWNALGGTMVLGPCQPWYLDVVREQREATAEAITTDTYLRRFTKGVGAQIQVASMGQVDNGTGLLLTVIGVRTDELVGTPVPGHSDSVSFAVRVQIAAIDSLTGEAVQIDTLRSVTASQGMVERHAWISLLTTMPLKRGLREIRLSVEQDDDRGSIFGAHVEGASAGFSVSDLVFGSETGAVTWRRNGTVVPVSPFSAYQVGDELPLYYEVYGLTVGSEYRTMISLQRARGSKVVSTVTFTDRATASTLGLARSLRLNDLKPGDYDLILTVEDLATGQKTVRQRAVPVLAP